MADAMETQSKSFFLAKSQFQTLIGLLKSEGYRTIGPTIDQEAIVYDEIDSIDQFPIGWTDEQGPGHYRLKEREDREWFGFAVGPHSWKRYLFPPTSTLLSAEKTDQGWSFIPRASDHTQYALLGVRACELAALRIQDRVFLEGPYQDPIYRERRERLLIVAVNCSQPADTCFCTSMNTGPSCQSGFDIRMTELSDGFVCDAATPKGEQILGNCSLRAASDDELQAAVQVQQGTVDQITRRMDTSDLPGLLRSNLNHPHWKEVGERCLSCTNCTMVCPTCFCSSVTEIRDLNVDRVERQRSWDSCFNPDFSYLGGSLVRNDTASRYRQWLTHKLDTWHSQFGTSGCVGCGRCITWCPVGIDITEEVAAFRQEAVS